MMKPILALILLAVGAWAALDLRHRLAMRNDARRFNKALRENRFNDAKAMLKENLAEIEKEAVEAGVWHDIDWEKLEQIIDDEKDQP